MAPPKIDSFRFGRIIIDGTPYNKDIVILPDGVRANWWRKEGHFLQLDDLDLVMEAQPELLIIGKGTVNRMRVSEEVLENCKNSGIETIELSSGDACERYNEVRLKKKTALALHLTC